MLIRIPPIRPWRRWLRSPAAPAEQFDVLARDGVRLAVHRVRPDSRDGPAVMLLHGLASNRRAFHFPGRSLAEWLAGRGFDCYLPELRGCGESERPAFDWWIDEYLCQDLPAIIDAIRLRNGNVQIHWVGHSLGGLLLLCYGILFP
ncbi:alpha/beta fold hydrolase, partial [Myxococcota bacterium]